MDKGLKIEMKRFLIRVLKGGGVVQPQETAILPEILKLMVEEEKGKKREEKGSYYWLYGKKMREEELTTLDKEVERQISDFAKKELEEAENARKREKKQVYINPDSLIGKELKYQTALLHEVLNEIRKRR